MKNYIVKRSNQSPFDIFDHSFENLFKPLFFDEQLDTMKTDIKETESGYELDIEMPGFNKKEISVSVEDEYLTVTAEKKEKEEDDASGRYLRKERSVSCQRSFYVGDVQEAEIKAKYVDGILQLSVPKAEPAKPEKHSVSID